MATNNSENTYLTATTTNEVTMPSQPAFLAVMSADATNVTGNGTNYTIAVATEIFDQNADYNNGTYTFTAPVTGRYDFNGNIGLDGIAGADIGHIWLVTSNRTYYSCSCDFTVAASVGTAYFNNLSVTADMDAADTVILRTLLRNQGADTVDVTWGGATTTPHTWFSGYLVY